MNKEFEVNGVQYMAVEVPEEKPHYKLISNTLLFGAKEFGNKAPQQISMLHIPAGPWEIVGLVGKLSLSDIHFKVFSYKSGYYDPEADSREAEAALYNEFTVLCEKHNLSDNSLIIKKI